MPDDDVGSNLIIDRLSAKDELTYQRGDTLDVKAIGKDAQIVAAISVALAGIFVWGQLWPREYEVEAAEKLPQWKTELEEFYEGVPDASAKVSALLTAGIIERATERIYANDAINKKRSNLLLWSYIFATLSLAINLLTLFGLGLIQHPS